MNSISQIIPFLDSAKFLYNLPTSILETKDSLDSSCSFLGQEINDTYKNTILKYVDFLKKHQWHTTAVISGTLLLETGPAIKAGFLSPTNLKKHFNFCNLNPTTLSKEQLNQNPTLLLHGSCSDQSTMLPLGKKLNDRNLGPVYSLNLPSGNITYLDYAIIDDKIDQIQSQYKSANIDNVKINIIGFSRGGRIAEGMYESQHKKNIGKIVSIGMVLSKNTYNWLKRYHSDFSDRIFEITAKHDFVIPNPSILPNDKKEEIDCGHLGLIYSDKTHQAIIEFLSN